MVFKIFGTGTTALQMLIQEHSFLSKKAAFRRVSEKAPRERIPLLPAGSSPESGPLAAAAAAATSSDMLSAQSKSELLYFLVLFFILDFVAGDGDF